MSYLFIDLFAVSLSHTSDYLCKNISFLYVVIRLMNFNCLGSTKSHFIESLEVLSKGMARMD